MTSAGKKERPSRALQVGAGCLPVSISAPRFAAPEKCCLIGAMRSTSHGLAHDATNDAHDWKIPRFA